MSNFRIPDMRNLDDEDEIELAFEKIRGWTNGSENPSILMADLLNKRKIVRGGANHLNLIKAAQINKRLFYLCPTIKSKMGRKILLEAEVKFSFYDRYQETK